MNIAYFTETGSSPILVVFHDKSGCYSLRNLTKLIFSPIDSFKVVSVDNQADFVNIYVQSRQRICHCPDCLSPSTKLHNYYLRKFRDLPTFGKSCNI